jgi:Do/DeqQ family serine protease
MAYHFLIANNKTYILEKKALAIKAAENDIQFSDRFKQIFSSATPSTFIKAAENSIDAVVSIQALSKTTGGSIITRIVESSDGSGVIMSQDGYIITNNHVIKNAESIAVLLNDQREYSASLIGSDESTDLALLKIESSDLPYLTFGNSDSVSVGEWVMAIGNPFKLQSTVTAGIVSAKGRNINLLQKTGIESFIQTDAAVNRGNSGGALINTNGELIGINTAILSEGGNYEGFSFAIPINLARKVINDIKEFGSVQRGWLGIEIINVDNNIANTYKLKEVGGVYLEMCYADGAATAAGLKRGDVILSVDGIETNTVAEFTEKIGTYRPGDKIEIYYFRNGVVNNTKVTLRNQINSTDIVIYRKDKELREFGIELRKLTQKEAKEIGQSGYYVVTVYKESPADLINIEPGYIITEMNGKDFTDVDLLIAHLNDKNAEISFEGKYQNYPEKFKYKVK